MTYSDIATKGLVLLGCGKMGSAMLEGWLKGGLPAASVYVIDPKPSEWLQATGAHLNTELPEAPAIVIVAVKPQMMGAALPTLQSMGGGSTLVISVAAGTPIKHFEAVLGADTPIVRAMPNTPAAVAQGITAIVGNKATTATHLNAAQALLEAVGTVVRLKSENQIDAVTGVSGSGPAYVFHFAEALQQAATELGLPADVALALVRGTLTGSLALADAEGWDNIITIKEIVSVSDTASPTDIKIKETKK